MSFSFDTLKEKLSSAPVLRGPDCKLPFHISIDAFDSAIGAVLGQKENLITHAIYFLSKNLTPAELNYTVTEKEFLTVIYAINKFRHYITGYEVFVHTNPSTIRYLMNKPVTNVRITRWLLPLQEFDITLLDRPGKENQVADFLSRLNHASEDVPNNDNFPNENLFVISVKKPWFIDMANYLVAGKLPPYFSSSQKKRIARKSANYSWITGNLFFIRPDLVICKCVGEDEMYDILRACHDERYVGHFANKQTTYKILRSSCYWPSLFKDAREYVRKCDRCQRIG